MFSGVQMKPAGYRSGKPLFGSQLADEVHSVAQASFEQAWPFAAHEAPNSSQPIQSAQMG